MTEVLFQGRLVLAESANTVATIKLARPDKLNALTPEMRVDLLAAFAAAEKSPVDRVIVLTGSGRAFCAGGDVRHLQQLKETGDRAGFCRILDEGTAIVRRLRSSPKLIIAALNGPAVGGGLILALACDLRYAAETAKLGMPFAKIGIGPDWGGTWLLTRLAGAAAALEMLATARLYSAAEAQTIGLVNRVCTDQLLLPTVYSAAEQIAAFPPDLIAGYKQNVYAAQAGGMSAASITERKNQLASFDHPDFLARLRRFTIEHGER